MARKQQYRPSFVRAWRERAKMSIDDLAAMAAVDKGNLSKLERGKLPYNQDVMERIAEALRTDVASLLTRDPSAPTPIWALMDRASPAERDQIERVAEALVKRQG
jgi:transcriptional regulator with XRE-family HTH domain